MGQAWDKRGAIFRRFILGKFIFGTRGTSVVGVFLESMRFIFRTRGTSVVGVFLESMRFIFRTRGTSVGAIFGSLF